MTDKINPEMFVTLMRNVEHAIDAHECMRKEKSVSPALAYRINYTIKSAIETVVAYVKNFLPEDPEETGIFLRDLHMALYNPVSERRTYDNFDHIYQVFWNRGSKTYIDALDDIWFVGILFNIFSNHEYQKTAEIVDYYLSTQLDMSIKNEDYIDYLNDVAFSCVEF